MYYHISTPTRCGGGGGGWEGRWVTHREYSIDNRNEEVVLIFPLFYIHCIHDSTHKSMTTSIVYKH